jgi:hypothetical protein
VACPQEYSSKAKVWLSYNDALEDSLSRPVDYKLRFTLTTRVSQILLFTTLISAIKVYSIQKKLYSIKGTFYHSCYHTKIKKEHLRKHLV